MSNPVTFTIGLEGASAVNSAIEGIALRLASLAGVVATLNKARSGIAEIIGLGGALVDLHDQTDQATSDLVILQSALVAHGKAAESAGQLTSLLQRALAGVNEDGTTTASTFAELKLSMGSLRNAGIIEVLERIGARLQTLPTQADRVAAATRLLSKSGAEFLPLLLDGGAFSQAKKDAGELANEMERNAQNFDRVGDKVDAFHLKMKAAYATIAEKLLPTIEKVVDTLNGVSATDLANGIQRAVEVGLLVGGTTGLSKFLKKAEFTLEDWATKPGAEIANIIGSSLLRFSGALAKILPLGLAAALAVEIGLGIQQAWWNAEIQRGDQLSGAQKENLEWIQKLTKARTEADAQAVAKERAAWTASYEARKKQLSEKANQVTGTVSNREGETFETKRGLSTAEQAELAAINVRLEGAARFNALLTDRARMEALIAQNTKADREADAKQQATAKAKKELFELETQLLAAQTQRNQPEIDRIQRLVEQKKLQADLKDIEDKGVDTAGLVNARLAAREDQIARLRTEQQAAFDLATQQQQAELKANLAEQNRLTLLANEKKYREELASLGKAAEPLVQARLAADKEALERQAAQVVLQAQLTAANGALDQIQQNRSLITQSQLLDESTKRQRLTANTQEYQKALAGVIELKMKERSLAVGAAEQAKIDAEIAALRASGAAYGVADVPPTKFQATKNRYADRNSPYQSFQSTSEGVTGGAMEFMTSIGSAADAAASSVNNGLNTALQGTQSALQGLFNGATGFRGAWNSAILSVRNGFTGMAAEWVAKEIWRFTVGAALKKAEVALHIGAETTKTGASAAGATSRGAIGVGETIFHGIQVVIRTTAHIAGEIGKTAISIVQSGIRIAATAAETVKELILAGIKAMSSVASIPYVGPVLAIAALAAVLAAGAGALKMRAAGGDVVAGSPYIVGDGGVPEVFVPDSDGVIIPSISAYSRLASTAVAAIGAKGAALAHTQAATESARASAGATAAGGANGRPLNVAVLDPQRDRSVIESLERDPRADTWFINKLRQHRVNLPGVRT